MAWGGDPLYHHLLMKFLKQTSKSLPDIQGWKKPMVFKLEIWFFLVFMFFFWFLGLSLESQK